MATLTDTQILEQVKIRLGISGTFHDELLSGLISDTKAFCLDAGVKSTVLNSDVSVGVISRGVADTWNYGSGDGEFSQMFFQRLTQLKVQAEVDNGSI